MLGTISIRLCDSGVVGVTRGAIRLCNSGFVGVILGTIRLCEDLGFAVVVLGCNFTIPAIS